MLKTLIAIPCLDMLSSQFAQSMMNLRKTEETSYGMYVSSMIYDSRNRFVSNAIINEYDRVLWLDSDMVFEPDMLMRLNADMDEHKADYVSALFFKRKFPTAPCVYKEIRYGTDDGLLRAEAIPYKDYPKDTVFECAGSGFGAVMVSVGLMRRIWETYGPPFDPMTQLGEDLSFCWRVKQLGYKMYCDSRVKVGHIGTYVFCEDTYLHQIASANTANE